MALPKMTDERTIKTLVYASWGSIAARERLKFIIGYSATPPMPRTCNCRTMYRCYARRTARDGGLTGIGQ